MTKPIITSLNALAPLIIQKYEHYLPTAFDESMSILQKLNKVIKRLDELGLLTNSIVEQWNAVMEWVMGEGLTEAVALKLDEMVADGTFDNIINEVLFGELNTKMDRVSITEYSELKISVAGGFDWTPAIQAAINEAKSTGKTAFIPKGVYDFYNTILLPEYVELEGTGESDSDSVLRYRGSVNGWAIQTSGQHQRNQLRNFRLDTNGLGNGIRLGLLGGSLIPVIFEVENVTVVNVTKPYWAMECNNLSHVTLERFRTGYGTMIGGNGLRIYADGGINSGVFHAKECVLGRVTATEAATDIALEINGSVNLDSYHFDTCYIGGQRVKIGENTVVRSVNFKSCHGEFKYVAGTTLTSLEGFQLYKVYGGSWEGGSITCFGNANSTAFNFKSDVKKFNIQGIEANAIMGAVYKQAAGTTVEGCILQEANLTNGSTAAQYDGVSDQNFKLMAKRFQTEIINVKNLYSIDQVNKEYWGTAPDPLQGHTRGDRIKNPSPSTTKNIIMWVCTVSGSAGGGSFMAFGSGFGTTIQRPPLNSQDAGYTYFDTDLAKMILWNGSSWQV